MNKYSDNVIKPAGFGRNSGREKGSVIMVWDCFFWAEEEGGFCFTVTLRQKYIDIT